MATFGFRLRFMLHGPRLNSHDVAIGLQLSEGIEVTLSPTWPDVRLMDASDLKLSGKGFATSEDAQRVGERLRTALRMSMGALRTGFDLGDDLPTTRSAQFLKDAALSSGYRQLDNVHGLAVFEEDIPTRFVLGRGDITVMTQLARITDEWRRQFELNRALDAREILALELYAHAHREPFARAKFVALATVVEVLAVRSARGDSALLDGFIGQVRASTLDEIERGSLESSLNNLRRGSIAGACRKYVTARLGKEPAARFAKFYEHRSRLVHDGVAPAIDLNQASGELDELVALLLQGLGQ